MSLYDVPRVVKAGRKFSAAIERHARQYAAPGYDTARGASTVLLAGRELHAALEGRTIFEPAGQPTNPGTFSGTVDEYAASIQYKIIRECLRRLLWRIGLRDDDGIGAQSGFHPSLGGLGELPEGGLEELPRLNEAVDELDKVVNAALLPGGPTPSDPAALADLIAKVKENLSLGDRLGWGTWENGTLARYRNEQRLLELDARLREMLGQTPETPVEGEDPPPDHHHELPDLVMLDQAAASVHTSKRTLERYKTEGTLPDPVREGGGGKPALYDWKVMRPWLENVFGVKLPERFPGNVR
jgi:hypothetical protein